MLFMGATVAIVFPDHVATSLSTGLASITGGRRPIWMPARSASSAILDITSAVASTDAGELWCSTDTEWFTVVGKILSRAIPIALQWSRWLGVSRRWVSARNATGARAVVNWRPYSRIASC